jgi:hypothetical protein
MPRRSPGRALGPALAVLVLPGLAWAEPVGTAFTYQGRLTDGGGPANGGYDLQFVLYDAAAGGAAVGPLQTRDDILVTGGLFTVSLDFGAVFGGARRWLEVGVRTGASTGPYATLSPRQELTPSPGALSAPWSGVAGKPPGFADDVDDDSGGDVTSLVAGPGLTGGGTSGALSLAVSFGASGVANTVARSDHDHFGQQWLASSTSSGLSVRNAAASGIGITVEGGSTGLLATVTGDIARGVYGAIDGDGGAGVFGYAPSGTSIAVQGESTSPDGRAVFGLNWASSGSAVAVEGETASPTGRGVLGRALATTGTNFGVYGQVASSQGYAGYFAGRAHVTGTLSKGAGAFKIDHPLDPENKYLYHSFVESPDMKNVYDGLVTTDAAGLAVVDLPDWFEALNRDFRYQLTVIGQLAQAVVAERIAGNRFVILTDLPRVDVSWQVTGIRKDPFAEKHRIPVEEDKPEGERGTYLHPEAWGVSKDRGLDETRRPPVAEAARIPR